MAKRVTCVLCGGRSRLWGLWPGLPLGTWWNLYHCSDDEILTVVAQDSQRDEIDQVDFHERKFDLTSEEVSAQVSEKQRLVEELAPWIGNPPAQVMELGAGRGTLSVAFARAGYVVTSSEPSAAMVNRARDQFGLTEAQLQATTGEKHLASLPDESVNAIVMWHVLEHLTDPWGTLQEVSRVLTPAGCLVMQVPMAAPEALFAAHSFVVLPMFPEALAKRLEMTAVYANADVARMFLTMVLSKDPAGTMRDHRPWRLPRQGLPSDMATWLAASRLHDPQWQNEVPE